MPEQQGQDERGQQADDQAHPERELEGRDHDGHAVAGGSEEGRLAEVEQTGVPELHVEADGGQAVRDRDGAERVGDRCGEDEFPVHSGLLSRPGSVDPGFPEVEP